MSSPQPLPPRHFWRRLFAYGIDVALCWIVVAIFFAALIEDRVAEDLSDMNKTLTFGFAFDTGAFRPPFQVGTSTCGDSIALREVIAEVVYPGELASARFCINRVFAIPVSGTASVEVKDTPEVADWPSRSVEFDLSILTVHRFADVIALGLFVALSIFFLRLAGTTPGKRLMGLRVLGTAPLPSFRREIVRSLPFALSVGAVSAWTELEFGNAANLVQAEMPIFLIQILAACAAIYLWFWPMAFWKGAMPHDRWLGLTLTRGTAI